MAQRLGGLAQAPILRMQIAFAQPRRFEQQPRIGQRARSRLAQRHALAAQILQRADRALGAHRDMDGLGEQSGDGAQVFSVRRLDDGRRPRRHHIARPIGGAAAIARRVTIR